MKEELLMRVQESRILTGLGILLLPEAPAPQLGPLALHTALPLRLRYPDKQEISATGTVEEIARAGEPLVRTLLLTQEGAEPPPTGTEVWVRGLSE